MLQRRVVMRPFVRHGAHDAALAVAQPGHRNAGLRAQLGIAALRGHDQPAADAPARPRSAPPHQPRPLHLRLGGRGTCSEGAAFRCAFSATRRLRASTIQPNGSGGSCASRWSKCSDRREGGRSGEEAREPTRGGHRHADHPVSTRRGGDGHGHPLGGTLFVDARSGHRPPPARAARRRRAGRHVRGVPPHRRPPGAQRAGRGPPPRRRLLREALLAPGGAQRRPQPGGAAGRRPRRRPLRPGPGRGLRHLRQPDDRRRAQAPLPGPHVDGAAAPHRPGAPPGPAPRRGDPGPAAAALAHGGASWPPRSARA